jgi:hypothetical protein
MSKHIPSIEDFIDGQMRGEEIGDAGASNRN